MWQYSTETIINNNEGRLANNRRFDIYDQDGTCAIDWSGSTPVLASGKSAYYFVIDGVVTFNVKTNTIDNIYHAGYQSEKYEQIQMLLDSSDATKYPTAGQVLRLQVKLREDGRVGSMYQNAYLRHQKPFEVEIESQADALKDAQEFKRVMNKMLNMSDFDFFSVSYAQVGEATNKVNLILTAKDCYARFVEARVDVVPKSNRNVGEALLGFQDYDNLVAWDKATYMVKGREGRGTVARLLKNLRIPTRPSTDPFAPDHGGMPIPGGKYDQFCIEYLSRRRQINGQIVGSNDDTTMTNHVFFIHQDVAAAFKALCEIANGDRSVKEAGDLSDASAKGANITQASANVAPQMDYKITDEHGSVE